MPQLSDNQFYYTLKSKKLLAVKDNNILLNNKSYRLEDNKEKFWEFVLANSFSLPEVFNTELFLINNEMVKELENILTNNNFKGNPFISCFEIDSLNISINIFCYDNKYLFEISAEDQIQIEGHDLIDWQGEEFDSVELLIQKVKSLS